jgi:glycosyltransferase XagB
MSFELWLLVGVSLFLTVQSAHAAALMLYAWEDQDKHEGNRAPKTYEPPRHTFTLLLPARHEEEVIQETIQRTVDLDYPRDMVQILVVIEAGDHGTIAKVNEKLDELRTQGIHNARLLTFADPPINKPHGLNIGLRHATGDIVTIFDAEDEPHADILNVVNTDMLRHGTPVVQCGVQLMNYDDRWYSALNVLEYFFWFKSRMHYHASVGMVPLGGNTVFIRRDTLEEMGGWDQHCLTEDAELGIRISAAGLPIRVLYEDAHVTREETPHSVGQFIKQRTRWNQGFMQVLAKRDWLKLPTWQQRALALYTLAFPFLQAFTVLYVPFSIWMILTLEVPILVAMISALPAYMLLLQFFISVVGLYEFTRAHHLRPSILSPLKLLIAYLPFQWMLGYAALRAVGRQVRGLNSWEKTAHVGAHRKGAPTVPATRVAALSTDKDSSHD